MEGMAEQWRFGDLRMNQTKPDPTSGLTTETQIRNNKWRR
jgi:hypothetical protein